MNEQPNFPPAERVALWALAETAGIYPHWRDAAGQSRTVNDDVLIALLEPLGYPAHTASQINDHLGLIASRTITPELPPMVTATQHEGFEIALLRDAERIPFRLVLESGKVVDGFAVRTGASRMALPGVSEAGYHQLEIADARVTLAVAPPRCFTIADTDSRRSRHWGVATQIYSLRRAEATGIGDFTALAELARELGAAGASAIGINPVHAGFAARPGQFSPYSPSSRLFLNPVYVDPAVSFGRLATIAAARATQSEAILKLADSHALIDWQNTSTARYKILRRLFDRRASLLNSQLVADLSNFRQSGGTVLREHALFEALSAAHLAHDGQDTDWRRWPESKPGLAATETFAQAHAEEIEFHVFLQWLARRGLEDSQRAAVASGMAIGIIGDLAVGTDPSGSQAWSRQDQMLLNVQCGAPPDIYNTRGQGWGLTAFSPTGLLRNGYQAFIEMLRAALGPFGGLRIDHVLGLMRLWLIPGGAGPAQGAYLAYPFEDLLRLISLESNRQRAIVVGENLGTVPDGFNERMRLRGIMGTSVLWFERGYASGDGLVRHHAGNVTADSFRAPNDWSAAAMATTTTHDLPTIAGWWEGRDLQWREQIAGAEPDTADDAARAHRRHERGLLWYALLEAGLVTGDLWSVPEEAPIESVLAFVAHADTPLTIFPLEDLAGWIEQPNLPGTTDEHPNWRRRMAAPLEALFNDPAILARLARIAATRPKSP